MKKNNYLLACLMCCGLASAQVRIYGLPIKSISDYSISCEKWGEKTEPDKRGSTCLAYLQGVKAGLGAVAGASKECAQ